MYAHEETGHYDIVGPPFHNNYPVDGGGNVDLHQPPAAMPGGNYLSAPWLAAVRVTGHYINYGEADHISATSNVLTFTCSALDAAGGAFTAGWADSAEKDGPDWSYTGSAGGPLVPPFWMGAMGSESFYLAGIWFGGTPPGIAGPAPDLIQNSGTPATSIHVNQAVCHVSYTMGGYEIGTDPFVWNPLYVQPGDAGLTVDAFLFEGNEEWIWTDVGGGRESWGILAKL
jgi:hypothetical protein